jgi:circadian clock protein KaiA
LHWQLSICIFSSSESLTQTLTQALSGERYKLNIVNIESQFLDAVERQKEEIDCSIFVYTPACLPIFNYLYERGILLPAIVAIESQELETRSSGLSELPTYFYHSAEVRLQWEQLEEIDYFVDRAIAQFLHLAPSCSLAQKPANIQLTYNDDGDRTFLMLQQRRLAEKLKERLGYLGVYYKRNSQYFYRNLPDSDKQELIETLTEQYQQILLSYFIKDSNINQAIDEFVNRAFFADISVSQILEIHMELMDEFAQKLKIEGRSEDILLDYRLTLIDVIAHLCEMYRRSIPREDFPFDLLHQID